MMKWNEVADRIDRLLSQKKYITERDINERIRGAKWTADNSNDPQQVERAEKIFAKYGIKSAAESAEPVKGPAASPEQVKAPVEKHDFTITDEHLGEGGQKAKFAANIAAIRTLKAIESKNRLATPEEQTVLSKYVGWGGLAQAFDENYRTRANNRSSIKDLEREKKRLETRLQKLIDGSGKAKDTSLTFEQLGFDSLVVDEAHNYKNGLVVSKMNRVSGVQTTPAQKSEDILMKTQYLNENYGEKNIIFATGTPVSNSMTELYIMQRYIHSVIFQILAV